MPLIQGKVGSISTTEHSEGSFPDARMTRDGALAVAAAHGRFFDALMRGRLFSGGMTTTSISNATFTTATLGATGTPIVGVYNPLNSGFNLNILQATLCVTVTVATNTGGGGFVWLTSNGNNVITTGNNPFNRKTLIASGSVAKDMSGVALTGLTTNMAARFGSALGGGSIANFSFVGTAAGQVTPQYTAVENFDGSLLVPPGSVLGLYCTTTPAAHSAASSILWEEIRIQD